MQLHDLYNKQDATRRNKAWSCLLSDSMRDLLCGAVHDVQAHNKAVRDVNFTHNGKYVLAADDTGAVKISSVNLKPLHEIKAHQMVSITLRDVMLRNCYDMLCCCSFWAALEGSDLPSCTALQLANPAASCCCCLLTGGACCVSKSI